jgi:hypothetical protein
LRGQDFFEVDAEISCFLDFMGRGVKTGFDESLTVRIEGVLEGKDAWFVFYGVRVGVHLNRSAFVLNNVCEGLCQTLNLFILFVCGTNRGRSCFPRVSPCFIGQGFFTKRSKTSRERFKRELERLWDLIDKAVSACGVLAEGGVWGGHTNE